MRQVDRRVVIAVAIALLADLRVANSQPVPGTQGPAELGMGSDPGGQDVGRRPEFGRGITDTASYLAGLKAELGITAEQEPDWHSYADSVESIANEESFATQMKAMRDNMLQTMPSATWPQRRDMMDAMFVGRQQAFNGVHAAAERLLPSLSTEQQAKAASTLPGLMRPGSGDRRDRDGIR